MKKILITITAIAFTTLATQAQVNTDVNETTTVQKVVEKGTDVKTKVLKKTETENETLVVEGNEKEDQDSKVISNKNNNVEVVADDISTDAENMDKMQQNMKKQQMALEASIRAEKEKAEMEKQMLLDKKMQMQKEMDERKAMLEHRPKGMAKLSKDE